MIIVAGSLYVDPADDQMAAIPDARVVQHQIASSTPR
jgi:hypothetical protein